MYLDGFVYSWRKIQTSAIWGDPVLFYIFHWCLYKANVFEQEVPFKTGPGTTSVRLLPGQFIFGRNQAAKELCLPPSTVRNKIVKLGTLQILDIKQDNQFSIISVINWDSYQNKEVEVGQAVGQPEDNQRTTRGHSSIKNKEIKKIKKPKPSCPSAPGFDEFWTAYPKKQAKGAAKAAWAKAVKLHDQNGQPPLLTRCLVALASQTHSNDWTKEAGKYVPLPATWLNQERWTDEPFTPETHDPDIETMGF